MGVCEKGACRCICGGSCVGVYGKEGICVGGEWGAAHVLGPRS